MVLKGAGDGGERPAARLKHTGLLYGLLDYERRSVFRPCRDDVLGKQRASQWVQIKGHSHLLGTCSKVPAAKVGHPWVSQHNGGR